MQRLENLQNNIYKTKFKGIYKLIFTADLDEVKDRSNWLMYGLKNYVEVNIPLWIIIESKILNKRIWISKKFGRFEIATAQLDLNVDSKEYHDSYKWYSFATQKDLCNKLEELLEPCFKKGQVEIEKDITDDMY